MAARGKKFPWEDKLLRSGYLLGAVLLHLIIFALLAGYVVFRSPPQEPAVQFTPQFNPIAHDTPVVHPPDSAAAGGAAPVISIDAGQGATPATTPNVIAGHDDIHVSVPAGATGVGIAPLPPGTHSAPHISAKGMSPERLQQIRAFVGAHRSLEKILQHDPAGDYPVYVASYADGDWGCNISFDAEGNIVAGSLPNLVAKISEWTHRQVNAHVVARPLKIGGPELAEQNPPFIFLTGHKDFVLTPQEVENLRDYVERGGLIWGDNAEAGGGSRFDVAFRREMKRVIPSEPFQTLAADTEIFRGRYAFDQMPQGMNYRAEPIEHVDLDGQIAILYTPDDYSDLCTIRILPGDAQIQGIWPATDSPLVTPGLFLSNRTIFFRNYTLPSSLAVQHLGLNIVTFLLTRFDDELQMVP
jgi:hypothetical protein